MKVGVVGEGAWGTAIASVLADNNHEIFLWCQDQVVAKSMIQTGVNGRYMPHFSLNMHHIIPITQFEELMHADIIFISTPVKYLHSVINPYSCLPHKKPLILLCKGIDYETGKLPTQLAQHSANIETENLFFLSGPSYAHDVMLKQPTGVIIAGENILFLKTLKSLLTTSYFQCTENSDIIGVQVAAAFKNVIALFIGILDGMGYADNTKTLAFYKSLSVLQALIRIYDGNPQTCWSLAGVGDALLSAWGSKSRNFLLGRSIGKGEKSNNYCEQSLYPESINTLQALQKLLSKTHHHFPLITLLYDVVFKQTNKESLIDWLTLTE